MHSLRASPPENFSYWEHLCGGGSRQREERNKVVMSPAEFTIFVLCCGSSSSLHKIDGTMQI